MLWTKTSAGQELVNLAQADRIYIESVDSLSPGHRKAYDQFEAQTGTPVEGDPAAPEGDFAVRCDLTRGFKTVPFTLLVVSSYEMGVTVLEDIAMRLEIDAMVYRLSDRIGALLPK